MATQITEPNGNHGPPKSKTPWVLLLPLALFAGALWQSNHEPDTPLGNMDMNGTMSHNAASNAVGNTTDSGPNATTKTRTAEVTYTIYVPDDNGKLHRKTIKEKDTVYVDGDATYHRNPDRALELLFKNAPDLFPAGTKLTDGGVKRPPGETGGLWQVSLNKGFQESEQWRSETVTQVALGAIALTTESALELSYPPRIQILVDGKPVQTLGEYDLSDPISTKEFNSLVTQG
ncbi:MAG TPA: GerMN domain-containing protein [Abditibacteriaceae bacterium]|jgi:hypothetical protein